MGFKNIQANKGFHSLDNVCFFPPYDPCLPVFCAELPITSAEFFNAGMQEIKPEVSLLVETESDDTAADRVRYGGKVYAIYRRYPMATGLTQLYLAEKAGVS